MTARSTTGRWILTRAAAETLGRFRDGQRSLRPGAWRRWGVTLAFGFVATCGVTAALTWLGRWLAPRGLQAWDEGALRTVVAGLIIGGCWMVVVAVATARAERDRTGAGS